MCVWTSRSFPRAVANRETALDIGVDGVREYVALIGVHEDMSVRQDASAIRGNVQAAGADAGATRPSAGGATRVRPLVAGATLGSTPSSGVSGPTPWQSHAPGRR